MPTAISVFGALTNFLVFQIDGFIKISRNGGFDTILGRLLDTNTVLTELLGGKADAKRCKCKGMQWWA